MALPLKPSIEHLRKQAKKRVKNSPALKLAAAQHQLAKEYGFKNWAELAREAKSLARFAAFDAFGSWETESHGSVTHRALVIGNTALVEQSGTSGIGWHGELRYAPFPVRKGDRVEVSFSARFSHPARFSVWIGQFRDPWQSLVADEDRFDERELEPEWRKFSFRVRIVSDEPEARLNFVFGGQDGIFSLREVALRRVG